MTPHQGSGAGQAIEDAYILAAILAHPLTTLETLPAALKVYEAIRLPHGIDVQRRSRENGKLYEFSEPRFAHLDLGTAGNDQQEAVDVGKLWESGHAAAENWQWAWTTDIDDDKDRAIKLLEEKLGKGVSV